MSADRHTLLDGKVHVYRRENSRFWQCAICLNGRNMRTSTRLTRLDLALDVAREWALDRIAEDRLNRRGGGVTLAAVADALAKTDRPPPRSGQKTFKDAADAFLAEYQAIARGERHPRYIAQKAQQLRLHLLPFFGRKPITEVTAGLIQDYRAHRLNPPTEEAKARRLADGKLKRVRPSKRPSRGTLHQEMVTLRQVLKTANRKGWIAAVPDMSAPYKSSGKISHRAWFSPEELKRLIDATAERARHPKKERWRGECEQFHDYVVFMANTGLRPDEASRIEYRDVEIVADEGTGERILEIKVRGKRGTGYCKSMPEAVAAFERLRNRANPQPTDLIFGKVQRELLKAILDELDLKTDREGNPRTAYSLRHTYICMRLMDGADIYQLAKNCRTSVEMIETFYASHIKTRVDASAINVRRRPNGRKAPSA